MDEYDSCSNRFDSRLLTAPDILFEDSHVLALAKPAGMLSQGVAGREATLEASARGYLNPGDPSSVYLGVIHRLDRPVSGVVLWAKTPRSARRIARQFEARTVIKEYHAIIETRPGSVAPSMGTQGLWEDWLTHATDAQGVVRVVTAEAPRSRLARTRFRSEGPEGLSVPDGLVRFRLWPETGRTHQLRAQASHRGWPIWGDIPYGASRPFSKGIALHARSLTFNHPTLGTTTTIVAPWPSAWNAGG